MKRTKKNAADIEEIPRGEIVAPIMSAAPIREGSDWKQRGRRHLVLWGIFLMTIIHPHSRTYATDGTWANPSNQSWGVSTNWSGGLIADGAGSTACFTNDFGLHVTVTLGAPRTVGVLKIGGSNGYTIQASSGQYLTMDNNGGGARIDQTASTAGNTVITPLQLNEDLTISNQSSNPLTISGSISTTGATSNLKIQCAAGGNIDFFLPGSLDIKGTITNSGVGQGKTTLDAPIGDHVTEIRQESSSSLLILGDKVTKGQITIVTGTVRASSSLGTASVRLDGGALQLYDSVYFGCLSGSNGTVISSGTAKSVLLTGSSSSSSTFAGSIQNGAGTLSFTKAGSGTLNLTGVNSYSGTTCVTGGKLIVGGTLNGTTAVTVTNSELNVNGSLNAAASVNIGAGGRLSGIGTTGPALIANGGILAPGGSNAGEFGRLNVASLSGSSGAVFSIKLGVSSTGSSPLAGSDYDQVLSNNGVSLGGMTLSLQTANLHSGDLYFIIINGGSGGVNGNFVDGTGAVIAQNQIISLGGQEFKISYIADSTTQNLIGGNDIVLQAVPEPSSWALLLAGLGAGCLRLVLLRRRPFNRNLF